MAISRRLRWAIIASLALCGAPAFADRDRDDDDDDDRFSFSAIATADQEVGGSTSEGIAKVTVRFNKALTKADVRLRVRGLEAPVAAAHFHCHRAGANGPVAFGLLNPGPLMDIDERVRLTLTGADFSGGDCMGSVGRPVSNIAALFFAMRDGLIYLNVHTSINPAGAVRGQMLQDDD